MSVWKEIRCDVSGPDCADNRNDNPMGFQSAPELRSEGKRTGWIRKYGEDICPQCKCDPSQA